MSSQLISRSADLARLRSEGYDVLLQAGHLLVKDVPYVTAAREIKRGMLVSTLTLAGDVTTIPDNHVVHFAGEYPCHADGSPIENFRNQSGRRDLGEGLLIDHTFSAKPTSGRYEDYYEKMATYVAILSGQAQGIDPSQTAKVFSVVRSDVHNDSPFNYLDTASTRSEIVAISSKLQLARIAIVGLGGTGSYVLDFVAKTPAREIHIFDGDIFGQHNAFRMPGAAGVDDLEKKSKKVHYLRDIYSKMHRGIVAHDVFLDGTSSDQLKGMDFVFLCLDSGPGKSGIVARLEEFNLPFIDVGLGLQVGGGALLGVARVTTSLPERRSHLRARVPLRGNGGENEYNRNIQVADLNALNAALAVVRWKKLFGFYLDLERECHSTYTVDGNLLLNEEKP
jgi:hypothetical protein